MGAHDNRPPINPNEDGQLTWFVSKEGKASASATLKGEMLMQFTVDVEKASLFLGSPVLC